MRDAIAMGNPHLAEVYSPPRVTSLAHQFGLRAGFALDLTVLDEDDGLPWDFDNIDKQKKAMRLVKEQKPYLLIGSPMCRAFSVIQHLNKQRMPAWTWEEMMAHGKRHLEFRCTLYREQLRGGRLFLHEHPASASSWSTTMMQELMDTPGVLSVVGHMCEVGMVSTDSTGSGPVLTPTRFLTNSKHIARNLNKKCSVHERHVHLMQYRAGPAQVYPPALCKANAQRTP